jgi:hypothetical protein
MKIVLIELREALRAGNSETVIAITVAAVYHSPHFLSLSVLALTERRYSLKSAAPLVGML